MMHKVRGRKLGRSPSHRIALRRNMIRALFQEHRIQTTLEKAKEMRPHAERLITLARSINAASNDKNSQNIAKIRRIVTALGNNAIAKQVARHLIQDIAPTFADRPGGYLRVLRLSGLRIGDAGQKAILELVNYKPRPKALPAAATKKAE